MDVHHAPFSLQSRVDVPFCVDLLKVLGVDSDVQIPITIGCFYVIAWLILKLLNHETTVYTLGIIMSEYIEYTGKAEQSVA